MRRRIAFAAVLLLALIPAPSARAALSPATYAQQIARVLAAVQAAQRDSGTVRAHDLAAARALLPPTVTIHLDGHNIAVDLRSVRADVVAGHLGSAEARLTALQNALSSPAAHIVAPDSRRLAALDRILSEPPITPAPTLWSIIGDFIKNSPIGSLISTIENLWNWLLDAATGNSGPLIPILAALIVAAAIVFAVSRSFGRVVPQTSPGEDEEIIITRLDTSTARERAATMAAQGDYRQAARYLYLSTLLALDEAGRLRIDGATSNRDLLRQARAVPRLAEALAPVVQSFDLFWFGRRPLTRDDYERYRRLNERVLEVAR